MKKFTIFGSIICFILSAVFLKWSAEELVQELTDNADNSFVWPYILATALICLASVFLAFKSR